MDYYSILKKINDTSSATGVYPEYYKVPMDNVSERDNLKILETSGLIILKYNLEVHTKEGGTINQWYAGLTPEGINYLDRFIKSKTEAETNNIKNELISNYLQNILSKILEINDSIKITNESIKEGNEKSHISSKRSNRMAISAIFVMILLSLFQYICNKIDNKNNNYNYPKSNSTVIKK
ncbi:MAG: hypothetical protein WC868_00505 [Bacteroidales bacterium]